MRHSIILLLGMTLWMTEGHAQNVNSQGARKALDDFRKETRKEFEEFRQQCLKEYADVVRNPWRLFEETPPVPAPKKDEVPPIVMPEDDKGKPLKDHSVVIDEVVNPIPIMPLPQPIEPIEETPVENQPRISFAFYGTDCNVRFDKDKLFSLTDISEESVAQTFEQMGNKDYDNMIIDCLRLRDDLQLNDWAYLQMLKQLSAIIAGNNTNVGTLLIAYLYMQSGYKMRIGSDYERLYLLFASRHTIYEQTSYSIDGETYYGIESLPSRLHICQAAFPKEKSLSLLLHCQPKFTESTSSERTISSKEYADMAVTTHVNKNLISFYDAYPASMIDNNFMTKWATYANTPISKDVETQLYSQLKKKIKGDTPLNAIEKLLNWVQTGFAYEYDDKVWGHDRAFFAEESLYYPYCDCEDRSILFTRIVRDVMGLECILVYYPGHLAAAVAFTNDDVRGDYIMLNGKRFIVCDPTYIGAPVGLTMPGMDNQKAKVILLNK